MSGDKKKKFLVTAEYDVRGGDKYFIVCSMVHEVWNQMQRASMIQKPDEDEVAHRFRVYQNVVDAVHECDIKVFALPKKLVKQSGKEYTDKELKVKAMSGGLELLDTIKDPLALQYYDVCDHVYPSLISSFAKGVSVGKPLRVK